MLNHWWNVESQIEIGLVYSWTQYINRLFWWTESNSTSNVWNFRDRYSHEFSYSETQVSPSCHISISTTFYTNWRYCSTFLRFRRILRHSLLFFSNSRVSTYILWIFHDISRFEVYAEKGKIWQLWPCDLMSLRLWARIWIHITWTCTYGTRI